MVVIWWWKKNSMNEVGMPASVVENIERAEAGSMPARNHRSNWVGNLPEEVGIVHV